MYFVGLDLAWGESKQTGVAAVDAGGRLMHVGIAQDDASIVDAVGPYTGDNCVVAFDAPLIVNNPTGFRPAETACNRDFQKFDAGAHPANTSNPLFNPPRGAELAAVLGLDMDPGSNANRRAIEVYPDPAIVVLFGLEKALKYKKGSFDERQRELLKLMTLIEGLDNATPRLRANRSVAWVELRRRVEAASKQSQLDRDEDAVDAVVAAYIASYWYHRPEDVTIYGDFETGYIVTPSPTALAPGRAERPQRRTSRSSLESRLIRAMELLEDAQKELVAIREALR
jgi:predicted RNase H-like nuclease